LRKDKIIANVRTLSAPITGVQRYTSELIKRLQKNIVLVSPVNKSLGIKGHAWEQIILPQKVKNNLLWSPGNTGPLSISNQVVTIHDLAPLDYPEWSNKKFALWYQFLIPRLIKKVRKIIAVSCFTKERILAIDPKVEDKIEVIYNGVNIEDFQKKLNSISQESQVEPYVLALGNMSPRKNVASIVKAWLSIEKRLPSNLLLKILGSLDNQGIYKFADIPKMPKNLQMLGYVDNLQLVHLYQNATAVIYVPLYEGFGLPVLEAMAAGSPVITSNSTAIMEVAANAARLVDPENISDLANSIVEVVENEKVRSELKKKGFNRAKEFNWENTAQLTIKVLDAAMQG
jgi:glycosyltransferase involved in cell wall biosynthesis